MRSSSTCMSPGSLRSIHLTEALTSYRLYATAIYTNRESSYLLYKDADPVPITIRRIPMATPGEYSVPVVFPTLMTTICVNTPRYVQNARKPLSLVGCTMPGVTLQQIAVNVVQLSMYGSDPDPKFRREFPIPREQPPDVPLRTPHELESLAMDGISFPGVLLKDYKEYILHPERKCVFNMGGCWHALEETLHSIPVSMCLNPDLVKLTYFSPYLLITHRIFFAINIAYRGEERRVLLAGLPLVVYDDRLQGTAGQMGPPSYADMQNYPAYLLSGFSGLPPYSRELGPGEIRRDGEPPSTIQETAEETFFFKSFHTP